MSACGMPGMTEQAYLTRLEEQWRPGNQLDSNLCEHAAGKGWLAALQWLRQKGASWDNQTCSAAARGDHLVVLQWALSQGCPWSSITIDIWNAAQSGHQELLMLAHRQGLSIDAQKWTCAVAAIAGQMATLQRMRKHGWHWDTFVCACAAAGGHFAVLQWATWPYGSGPASRDVTGTANCARMQLKEAT